MADYGVGVSKQGYDVTSGLTIDYMIFDSETFLFKGNVSGSTSISAPAGSSSYSVAHGLGYRPAVKAYWSTDNVNWQGAGLCNSASTNIILFVGATTSNIVFDVLNYSGTTTVYIRWQSYVDNLG